MIWRKDLVYNNENMCHLGYYHSVRLKKTYKLIIILVDKFQN